jgi:hypothetical protein
MDRARGRGLQCPRSLNIRHLAEHFKRAIRDVSFLNSSLKLSKPFIRMRFSTTCKGSHIQAALAQHERRPQADRSRPHHRGFARL